MQITPDIYNLIVKTAKFVTKGRQYEDLIQESCIDLLKCKSQVEFIPTFVRTTVRNRHIDMVRQKKVYDKYNQSYFDSQETEHNDIFPGLISKEYSRLLRLFDESPTQKDILTLVMNNPDTTYTELAQSIGMNKDTFKANIRHIQTKLFCVRPDKE